MFINARSASAVTDSRQTRSFNTHNFPHNGELIPIIEIQGSVTPPKFSMNSCGKLQRKRLRKGEKEELLGAFLALESSREQKSLLFLTC